jgi:Tol biopolymer transport system component
VRKSRAAHYLTLLIAGTLLVLVSTSSTAQPTPNQSRRHNGKIVFTSDRQYKGLSIWTMNPDGSSPTRLTDDSSRTEKLPHFSPVYDGSPVWSPDGRRIAFISNRDYLFSLYVMDADGSNARLVTSNPLEPSEPAWSPDGEKIAFSAGIKITIGMTKPSAHIYVINVDGSGLTQLTRGSGSNGTPAWSPDGKQIAFVSDRDADGKSKIWIMNADGSNPRVLPNSQNTSGTGFHGGSPDWSPDGTKILFTAYDDCPGQGGVSIYVTNAEGGQSQRLTKHSDGCSWYSAPRWSPDGTRILATLTIKTGKVMDPAPEIVVMNADGSNQIKLSNRGKYGFNSGLSLFTDSHADWQPVSAPLDPSSSIVGFSAPSYTVYDDAGKIPITATRTGNLKDIASCLYVTITSDMGLEHPDPAAKGTVRFERGESSKTISLPVVDYKGLISTTTYKIVLSDNEGNATFIGGIKEATLTVLGRDAESRKKNPN